MPPADEGAAHDTEQDVLLVDNVVTCDDALDVPQEGQASLASPNSSKATLAIAAASVSLLSGLASYYILIALQ